ncbi:MAG: 4-hydroxy-tetrahydrodipicolinate synthase [Zetaproteobacteria bacterium CG_4_9_14_3_um_filter_49_83]|nr:MAG: 4-hydroxy-tetrahydrodipicolinate synthase [Zetaproteobacteria bacterium CG1_02_49_23]PIQ31769.1 MAG: 4-hydroxy-tetrahydrodipicolinate synthase [Zetaproteobacteria bacterium CG17_big_fil_post_rev_8_21_14_2_50_50_13]PIV31406.1 MAG: 4-hydroxy-tetrahydrodipicolinate synthase [Zetaproteobacteria bacterium CG02_land_8_20_14_3_00_50_9]PIY56640.1 MAG: 4-hydroxy-tetrahydrodipicolinate synthase [Zetaproteobacteria bacterium CG_4_10_14_0_8_um_filter_49_80]PJA34195.1 MAG: 4-hydroxy-tetrahydrodipico
MFHGTITALVTPFKGGKIDEDAFRAHIERQIEDGVDGIVPAGTTGEAATLSFDEHKKVIAIAVKQAAGRVPVIAGTGSNNTQESIELTQAAKSLGADAALLISPYYNKPSQEGIYQHYKAVAQAVHVPQILYNVPGRTNSHIATATIERLSHIANIVGVKDATGDMEYLTANILACGERLEFFSGDDASTLPFLALGGHGVISVVSNIAPKTMRQLTCAMRSADIATAKRAHFALHHLSKAMFVEANPIPVKAACAALGWMSNELRLPLTPLQDVDGLLSVMRQFVSDEESFNSL